MEHNIHWPNKNAIFFNSSKLNQFSSYGTQNPEKPYHPAIVIFCTPTEKGCHCTLRSSTIIFSNKLPWSFVAVTGQVLTTSNWVYFFTDDEIVHCSSPTNLQNDVCASTALASRNHVIHTRHHPLKCWACFSLSLSPVCKVCCCTETGLYQQHHFHWTSAWNTAALLRCVADVVTVANSAVHKILLRLLQVWWKNIKFTTIYYVRFLGYSVIRKLLKWIHFWLTYTHLLASFFAGQTRKRN